MRPSRRFRVDVRSLLQDRKLLSEVKSSQDREMQEMRITALQSYSDVLGTMDYGEVEKHRTDWRRRWDEHAAEFTPGPGRRKWVERAKKVHSLILSFDASYC